MTMRSGSMRPSAPMLLGFVTAAVGCRGETARLELAGSGLEPGVLEPPGREASQREVSGFTQRNPSNRPKIDVVRLSVDRHRCHRSLQRFQIRQHA